MPRIHPPHRQPRGRGLLRPWPAAGLLWLCGTLGTVAAADFPTGQPAAPALVPQAAPVRPCPSVAPPALALRHGFRLGDGAGTAAGFSIQVALSAGIAAAMTSPRFGTSLSDDLIGSMEREALRYRRQSALPSYDADEDADTFLAAERSRQAGRILTRSFKRTARQHLERALRSSDALGSLLDRSWDFGGRGDSASAGTGRGRDDPGAPGREAGRTPRGASGSSLRLRLDAHPRLVLDTRFLGGRGRIELPLRDEPVRLSFERSIGARGRAILSAGLQPGGPDTTSLTFSFGF